MILIGPQKPACSTYPRTPAPPHPLFLLEREGGAGVRPGSARRSDSQQPMLLASLGARRVAPRVLL
jgi:hypothetical protein